MPTFGSLFAGIGGIDLGLERAGWECRWQVEYDPFCQHVLAHHWPDVPRYGDIRAVDWTAVEPVDLIAGGFPCQPVSIPGRLLAQADPRWLWPEFARAVGALRPRLVLVENVPGLLLRGLGDVIGDLAALGYDAEWDCLPAAAVGAPHRRDRVWIVAYPDSLGRGLGGGDAERDYGEPGGRAARRAQRLTPTRGQALADGDGLGRLWLSSEHGTAGALDVEPWNDAPRRGDERGRDREGDDGSPGGDAGWWATEPDVGRVAHGVPARVDRLRALGNAVVPQVVEVIGRQLLAAIEHVA